MARWHDARNRPPIEAETAAAIDELRSITERADLLAEVAGVQLGAHDPDRIPAALPTETRQALLEEAARRRTAYRRRRRHRRDRALGRDRPPPRCPARAGTTRDRWTGADRAHRTVIPQHRAGRNLTA